MPSNASKPTEFSLDPGRNCWRLVTADRFAVVVDAANYFHAAKSAMLKARHSIFLLGWDFDARVEFEPDNQTLEGPNRVGPFLDWLAERREGLTINLLKWDIGMVRSLGRGETPLFVLNWLAHSRVRLELDSCHPKLAAHHMKLLVVDDVLAFCGGIDMTEGRWDTRNHFENQPGRRSVWNKQLDPWHDMTSCMSGPAAAALGDLARKRWQRATGESLDPPPAVDPVWPEGLTPDATDCEVGLARTVAEHDGHPQTSEIEKLTFDIIRAARKNLYIESQYLASRAIADALGKRLEEPDGPEIVLLNPDTADGWLEAKAMDSARVRLLHMLRAADRYDRFRCYYPVNEAGTPIYVHAKIMLADDRLLRIGSANLNNRSMGYDTECDLLIDAERQTDASAARKMVAARRADLLAEHLAADAETVAACLDETGSLIATIDRHNTAGRHLRPLPLRELTPDEQMIEQTDLVDPERPTPLTEQIGQILKRGRRILSGERATPRLRPRTGK